MGLIDVDKVKEYVLTKGFYCDTDTDKEATAEEIDQLFPTVEAIPIEYIQRWNNNYIADTMRNGRTIINQMLEDWRKENADV